MNDALARHMLGESTTVPAAFSDEIALPASPRRTIPPSLASRYDDITFVGEGGMGSVYRGRDPRLGRTVALKFIKSDSAAVWQRFIQEAKSQARIQHASVCPVYEAGQADGEPYIAMQYISGEPLSRIKSRLSLEQNVKLIMDIALAVHEAHRLGLIHRDIKPGNILVEMQQDGALKPYIMDFGLAREVEKEGQTVTGAIVGTIAYMPPEQANGEIRTLDRRSDVYSLGATLYDTLAGRPPFVADTHWKLILVVGSEEPPRLSAIKPGLPVDLETIVMKCLERSPSRRYDSAKALAEDLRRFLDGDPILAKRSSWGYVIWKKTRKHKLFVTLAIIALLVAAVPMGAFLHSRRQIATQVELSRTLGEDIKAMELYMRVAYSMPLHDVEKERGIVRGRFTSIEQRMKGAGTAGEGPGHYALGRGLLVLGDTKNALLHLQRAKAAGFSSPELEYALGRVLGEIYREELEATKRIPAGERRQAMVKEIETKYRDPAQTHLRAAVTGVESPAYAEGLLAFYEGRYDRALEKARQAFKESSMMYEAKKLEADTLQAQGSQYRHDAVFDYNKLMTYLEPAAQAYATASNFARSDPNVHLAECELWGNITFANVESGREPYAAFEKAKSACLRANEASSKDVRARIQLAFSHNIIAFYTAGGSLKSDDPESLIDDTVRFAETAREAAPDNAMAHYIVGSAYFSKSKYMVGRGKDPAAAPKESIDAYEAAIRLDPQFLWAHAELAGVVRHEVTRMLWRSLADDGITALAFRAADRAIAINPESFFSWNNKGLLHQTLGSAFAELGQNPTEQWRKAIEAYRQGEKSSPNSWQCHNNMAETYTFVAEYEMLRGEDPTTSLRTARDKLKRALETGGGGSTLIDTAGFVSLSEARHLLRQRRDPSVPLEEARRAFVQAAQDTPWKVAYAANQTLTEIIALRWAIQQRQATADMFDAAFAPVKPFLAQDLGNPWFYVTVAKAHALKADWLVASGQSAATDIEQGLGMVAKAHQINPRHAEAFAVQGQLLLAKARAARDAQAKATATKSAKEALERAFTENKLLESEYGQVLREIGSSE